MIFICLEIKMKTPKLIEINFFVRIYKNKTKLRRK